MISTHSIVRQYKWRYTNLDIMCHCLPYIPTTQENQQKQNNIICRISQWLRCIDYSLLTRLKIEGIITCGYCKYWKYVCSLWQYGLWSFQTGGTKLEIFLPKNLQDTQRKLLNFENWISGDLRSFQKSEFYKSIILILPFDHLHCITYNYWEDENK